MALLPVVVSSLLLLQQVEAHAQGQVSTDKAADGAAASAGRIQDAGTGVDDPILDTERLNRPNPLKRTILDEDKPTFTADEVVVEGSAPVSEGALVAEGVDGLRIFTGRKSTFIDGTDLLADSAGNVRSIFQRAPGLYVSEMQSPSIFNLNYRGIGDPHESQDTAVLRDGTPITSDWFGYPTLYYLPPMGIVERVEIHRGGGALLYGPQPGAIVNFETKDAPFGTPFAGETTHLGGSDGLYEMVNLFSGSEEQFGWTLYQRHRQSDGPRHNADSVVNDGGAKLMYGTPERPYRWTVAVDSYESENGEPGRLSLNEFLMSEYTTRTPFDRLWVSRHEGRVRFEARPDDRLEFQASSWVGYQDRFSRRSSTLDRQEFYFGGFDGRALLRYDAWGEEHELAAGFVTYASESPRSRHTGANALATTGTPVFEIERSTAYGALFAENRFNFGDLSILPSARLDISNMRASEEFNTFVAGSRPLLSEESTEAVPLFAIGAEYRLPAETRLYANLSQGYKPKEYDDLVNPGDREQRGGAGLDAASTWTVELGATGKPVPWWSWDTSLFYTDYDNYFETINSGTPQELRSNSGRAVYQGVEMASEVSLVQAFATGFRNESKECDFDAGFYSSLQLLDAEFVSGVRDQRTPAFAPGYLVKLGPQIKYRDIAKLSLNGQFTGPVYWQDSNADLVLGAPRAGQRIPSQIDSLSLWDLSAEVTPFGRHFTILGGISNLFDEKYTSRIRTDGIEPGTRRSFYIGARLSY